MFDERVWELIAQVPEGRVTTYGAIARALGSKAYRRVGQACNRSPGMPEVPCHRVVASDGRLHGYAHGLTAKEARLLEEGVAVEDMRVDLERFEFEL